MAQKIRVPAYMKNVGKSMMYTVGDVFTEYNPTVASIVRGTKSTSESVARSMKDMARTASKNAKGFMDADQSILTNMIDDLKTGNWYNKERSENSLFGDLDFSFDDDDFEDWGDDNKSSSAKDAIEANDSRSKQIISSMGQISGDISRSIGYSSAQSAEYIVKSNQASQKAIYSLTAGGFNQVTTVLLSINSNIEGIARIGEPLNVHMQNSAVFYTNTTQALNKLNESLDKIVSRTTYMDSYNTAANKKKTKKGISQFYNGDVFDFEAYMESIGTNLKEQQSTINSLMDLAKMMIGDNGKNISPMQFLMTSGFKKMIPEATKEAMKELNKSISDAMLVGMTKGSKAARNSTNPIVNLLGSIFLPQDNFKDKVNTGNYTKGAVPFDGYTKKAITGVIPTYLAKIYASLGGEEKYFNYETGKFESIKDIRSKLSDDQSNAAKAAGGEFRLQLIDSVDRRDYMSDEAKAAQIEQIERYFLQAFLSGDTDVLNLAEDEATLEKFGIDRATARLIRNKAKTLMASKYKKKRNAVRNFNTDTIRARNSYTSAIDRDEESGVSTSFVAGNNFASAEDKHNRTILDYNRDILQMVGNIYALMAPDRTVSATSAGLYDIDHDRINTAAGGSAKSGGGEKSNMDSSSKRKYEPTQEDRLKMIGMSESERKAYLDRKELEQKAKEGKKAVQSKVKDAAESLGKKNSKVAKATGAVKEKYDSIQEGYLGAFESVSNVINSLSTSINDLFYGEGGFKDRLNSFWDDIKQKATDKMKELWDSTGLGESMKEAWSKLKQNVVDRVATPILGSERMSAIRAKRQQRTASADASGAPGGEGSGLLSGGASSLGDFASDMKQKSSDAFKSINESGAVGAVKSGAYLLSGGIAQFVSAMFGGDEKKQQEDKKKVNNAIKTALEEAGDKKGAMAVGGIAGAGVSLLTGAIVGPLAGAAIGAGAGLIMSSEKVQKALFGEPDENGNYDKPIGNFIMNQLPSVGIGTGVGATIGAFAGSPLVGAIIGGGIGFVSQSEKAKEFLFGKDEDHKTMLGKAKDLIKNNAPNIAAGTIAGLVAGPFGIAGNALLGAGIGYLSTTEKFKSFMFGDQEFDKDGNPTGKRTGGLAKELHDKIINPLDEIMHNMGNAIKGSLSRLGKRIDNRFKLWGAKISKQFDVMFPNLSKAFKGVATALNPVKLAGKALGAINNKVAKRNLNKGYDVWNAAEGRNMTAAEREMNRVFLGANTNGKFSHLDQLLANAESPEDLIALQEAMQQIGDRKVNQAQAYKEAVDGEGGLSAQLRAAGLDAKTINKINKLTINGGKRANGKIDNILAGMSEDQREQIGKIIGEARGKMDQSDEAFMDSSAALRMLKEKGIKLKDIDTVNASALIDTELGRFAKTDEQKAAEAAEQTQENTKDTAEGVTNIAGNVAQILKHLDPQAKIGDDSLTGRLKGTFKNIFGSKESSTEAGASGSGLYNQAIRRLSGGASDGADQKTEFTNNGPIQYIRNRLGEWVLDRSDSETKSTLKKQDEFNKNISGIGKISGILGGFSGILTALKTGLLGDGEKKEGILSKLFSGLFGEQGAFSGLLSYITGKTGKLGSIVKTITSNPQALLSGVISNIVGPGLLIAGLGGAFDSAASTLTNDAYNEKSSSASTTYDVTTSDGTVINGATKDANGNFVDKAGNVISNVASVGNVKSGRASFSDRLKYNAVRGAVTVTKSVTSAVLGKTSPGKAISKYVAKATENGVALTLFDSIDEVIKKMVKKLGSIPFLKSVDLDGMGNALSGKIAKALESQSAKNLAKFASNAVVIARIAFVVVDFTTGFQDARTTLGITDEPTTGQKILSGLVRTIKNLIPIVGTLIPDSLVIDVFCDYLAPALGIDVEALKSQRAAAQEEVDKYNEENGTNLSVGDYNKQVLGDYTWTEKIGNKAKEIGNNVKISATNAINTIKEKGIGGAIQDGMATAVDNFKNSKVGGAITNMASKITNSIKLLTQQDEYLESVMTNPDSSFSDMFKIPEDDPENPMGGFMKALIFYKRLMVFPSVLVKVTAKRIWKGINDKIITPIKSGIKEIFNVESQLMDAAKTGSVETLMSLDVTDTEENPIGGLLKGFTAIEKIYYIPTTLMFKVGNSIKSVFENTVGDVKSNVSTFSTAIETLKTAAKDGDLTTIANTTFDKGDGVVGNFFNIAFNVNKVFQSIVAVINKIIGPIKEVIGGVVETVGGVVNTVKDGISDKVEGVKEGVSNALGTAKDKLSDAGSKVWSGLTNWWSGGDSGFVSQFDPRYQGYKVSGANFGAKGCGPAVASMAARAFGKNLSVSNAVSNARGYETSNGVTLDYFQKALGSKGISTELIAGGSSADMYSRLARGEKVVLLGRDPYNTSKDNSPFGPNNHYVLANGLDRHGNVVVSDPELNGPRSYNPSILRSATYGIAGGTSGLARSKFSYMFSGAGDVAAQVWKFFRDKGYSEQATAGIMGNLKAESGMNPSAIQSNGKGPAAGIAQWENINKKSGRWLALYNYAKSKGRDWTDLQCQLEFIDNELPGALKTYSGKVYTYSNGTETWWPTKVTIADFKKCTSVNTATDMFERTFEKPSHPNREKRRAFANEYYTQFTGKQGEAITGGTSYSGDTSVGTTSSASTESGSTGKTSLLGLVSNIGSVFSSAFGKLFNPSDDSSTESTGSDATSGTTTDGTSYNVSSANFSGAKTPIDYMKAILGKIQYSMSGARNPDKGSADCSSTVNWAIKKAGGPDIGGSTLAQYNNKNLSTVWYGNGSYASSLPSNIQPNDVLFFSRPTSDYTKGRPDRVGHVELYEGNGKMIGHGSGMGPKEKNVPLGSSGKLIKIARVNTAGAGSGLYINSYEDLARSGGSSGLLIGSRAGGRSGMVAIRDPRTGNLIPVNRFSGGDSSITAQTTQMLQNISSNAKNSGISPELVAKLLQSITSLLDNIANNTAPVNAIYQVLKAYIAGGGASGIETAKINTNKKSDNPSATTGSNDVDENISALVGVLAELAKG